MRETFDITSWTGPFDGQTRTHAQDALLGLANALSAITEKKAACDTLSRLRADFPQQRSDIAAGAAAAAQKTGCH